MDALASLGIANLTTGQRCTTASAHVLPFPFFNLYLPRGAAGVGRGAVGGQVLQWELVGGKAVEWFSILVWCPVLYCRSISHLSRQEEISRRYDSMDRSVSTLRSE